MLKVPEHGVSKSICEGVFFNIVLNFGNTLALELELGHESLTILETGVEFTFSKQALGKQALCVTSSPFKGHLTGLKTLVRCQIFFPCRQG